MSADDITAVFTAIAAISGLFFGGISLWKQGKYLDAENILKIMDRSFEAEKRFSGIIKSSDEEREWIANEHFNFLEAISCLYNNRLVSKFSREWCKDVVLNNLAAIQAMPWLHDTFIKSVTREDTYKELQVFLKKYKKEITSLANAHSNGVLNIDK